MSVTGQWRGFDVDFCRALAAAIFNDASKVRFIPLSALNGDMVVERGARLNWYDGPTLLDVLESAPPAHS